MKLLPAFTLLAALSARGATNVVTTANDTGAGSLREAIVNSFSGDTVTFTNTLSAGTVLLTSGQLLLNKNLTIDGSTLPGGIQINGNSISRVFYITNGAFATLKWLTIANGLATAGDLTTGGGGGGIFCRGRVDLLNCSIVSNTVFSSTNSFAGGIGCDHGEVRLTACTLAGNSANTEGGAIYNLLGTLTLAQCTLSSNTAGSFGGAIVNAGGTLALTNCTLALNHSINPLFPAGGGGIDNYNSGTINLTANIIAGNTAATGNGPDLFMESGTLTATNCLVGDGASSRITNGISGNIVGSTGSPTNALLAPLGNYGGTTQTMPPLPGSLAIDAAGTAGFTTDQRGFPRPVGSAADIGAVEGIYNTIGPGKITSITRLGDGSIQFSFTNFTDASFAVVATTNLTQSMSNWTTIGFVSESPVGSGQFPFTDMQATNYPQRFYRVKSP